MPESKVVREILRQGRNKPRKYVKSALATGIVESGLRNLSGGDADSAGWRQERASIYANPTNIKASVRRYYQEAKQHDRGQSSAQLSADVQRPAAQYRGRYGEHSVQQQAARLLRGGGGGGSGSSRGSGSRMSDFRRASVTVGREQSFDKAGFEQAKRSALVGQLLSKRNPNSILFKSGLLSTQMPNEADFTSSQLVTKTDPGTNPRLVGGGSGGNAAAAGELSSALRWAESKIGVKEVNGSNRGKQIDQWQKRFGFTAAPWCGIFVGMALKKAGVQGIGSWIASTSAIEQKAKSKQGPFSGWTSVKNAQPGDLVVRSGQHVEIVTSNKNGVLKTIGGNTSDSVARRTYKGSGGFTGAAKVRR